MSVDCYPDFAPYMYMGRLIRCVDGDTVDLELDLGFHLHTRMRFRLAGIDTPERGQPGYKEATMHLHTLLKGKPIGVHSVKNGKYGRWLAELFVQGQSVNEEMLESGHAKEYGK